MKISVIIPVYYAEKLYLLRLLNQPFSLKMYMK